MPVLPVDVIARSVLMAAALAIPVAAIVIFVINYLSARTNRERKPPE